MVAEDPRASRLVLLPAVFGNGHAAKLQWRGPIPFADRQQGNSVLRGRQ